MRAISVDFRPPSALRTTAVAMGVLASAGMTAPAALAAGDEPVDESGTTVPEAGTRTGEVLTPTPLPEAEAEAETEAEPEGAHFGWGKLEPDVVLAPGTSLPAGAVLDRTGAQIRVTYSQVWGEDTSSVLECTWDESDADGNGNPCDFTGAADLVSDLGEARLYPMSSFTVELTAAPTSGQVLLPAAPGRAIRGYTDWYPDGSVSAEFEAPVAHRDAPAAVGSPADTDPPVSPVAVPTVPEQSVPTTPDSTPSATPAGVTPAATTDAPAASGAGEELAATGAEPVPVLAFGAGLVLAGGAMIVAAARRRTR